MITFLSAAYRRWPFRPRCAPGRHALPCRLRPGWLRAMGPDCFEGS